MSVISHMMYRRNHSPGRGLTICQPWELPNNFSLLYNCSSLSSNRQDDMMDSESFKSGHPTRHIALFSVNLLTIGHEELFKQLQSCGEIRTLYPFLTAGITIISYYKLTDAKKGFDVIKQNFYQSYKVCFAKPCLINKPLNERFFMVISTQSTSQNTKSIKLMSLVSKFGVIHSLSEAVASMSTKLVNVEFDDERVFSTIHTRLNNARIEDSTIQILQTQNDMFNCTCNQDVLAELKEPPPLNEKPIDWNIMSAVNLPDNHSYFSCDPFVKTRSVEEPVESDQSSSSSSLYSQNSSSAKPYPPSSDCSISSQESIHTVNHERKDYIGSSSFSLVSGSESNKTMSTSKRPSIDSATSIQIVSADKAQPINSGVVSTVKKELASKADVKNSRSYSAAVLSTGIKKIVSHISSSAPTNKLDISRIISKQDVRTTFMIRNIPNKYTQEMLMDLINQTNENTYDFLYLRMDFKNKCNVGYAFINFIKVESVLALSQKCEGKRWSKFNSDKRFQLSYADIQSKQALIKKFQNSQVMEQDVGYQPKLFYSCGPRQGKEQPFPRPNGEGKKHKTNNRRH